MLKLVSDFEGWVGVGWRVVNIFFKLLQCTPATGGWGWVIIPQNSY